MKQNVDLAIFFLEQGGSFSLISKQLHKNKKNCDGRSWKKPNRFQYVGKFLKNDDEIFKLAFQQDREILRYASERLGKRNIQS